MNYLIFYNETWYVDVSSRLSEQFGSRSRSQYRLKISKILFLPYLLNLLQFKHGIVVISDHEPECFVGTFQCCPTKLGVMVHHRDLGCYAKRLGL